VDVPMSWCQLLKVSELLCPECTQY
jgi:hypothetical protein